MSFKQEEAVLKNILYPGLEISPTTVLRLGGGGKTLL